jgi:hypothetical protein
MDLLVLFERGVIVGDMESIHMVRRCAIVRHTGTVTNGTTVPLNEGTMTQLYYPSPS